MKYLFLLLLLIPVVSAQTYFYADGQSLAVKEQDFQFIYHDRLGTDFSTKSLPFGQVTTQGDRFGFTGKELDKSGLHYFAARYYDSNLGRFTSTDVVPGEPSYQYVANDPLNSIDPDGNSLRSKAVRWVINGFKKHILRKAPQNIPQKATESVTELTVKASLRDASDSDKRLISEMTEILMGRKTTKGTPNPWGGKITKPGERTVGRLTDDAPHPNHAGEFDPITKEIRIAGGPVTITTAAKRQTYRHEKSHAIWDKLPQSARKEIETVAIVEDVQLITINDLISPRAASPQEAVMRAFNIDNHYLARHELMLDRPLTDIEKIRFGIDEIVARGAQNPGLYDSLERIYPYFMQTIRKHGFLTPSKTLDNLNKVTPTP